MEEYKVVNNPTHNRYVMDLGDGLAFIEYGHFKEDLVIIHTFVPESHRGQGIAGKMIKGMLDDVRVKGLKLIVYCPAVSKYIDSHPEYKDLLDAEYPR